MRVVLDSGEVLDLGETEATPTIGIVDYSRRVTDDYGVTTVVERGFAQRMSVNLVVPFDQTDALHRHLTAIRAKPARWIADEGVAWLDFRGLYKDFEVNLPVPPKAYCTLTVEALTATEAFADPGGDPAPLGHASTLQLLQPATIEGGALVASTVPENDYPEWSAGTTYPLGARVIKAATHRIYESGSIGNVGNDPTGTSGKWQDIGPTNRWAMFDQALGSTTEAPGQITVSLAPGAANAVALLDVKAATVRVVTTGYDRTLVPNASGTVTFLDMPETAGQVTVVITGPGTVEVGTLLVGKLVGLGSTTEDAKAGITDFSRKEADEFGDIQIVERAWAKRMTLPAKLRRDAIDLVAGRIAAVRAKPSLWIGKEGMETLTVYGFFKDFSIAVDTTICTLSLSIEGLSTAGKVEPLAASVDWPDVGDPAGTKPEDNATVGAPAGTEVAGKPAEEVVGQLEEQEQQLDQLDIDVAQATINIAAAQATIVQMQTVAAETKAELEADIASINATADQIQADAAATRASLATAQADIIAAGGRIDTIETTLGDQNASITSLAQTVSNHTGRLASIDTTLTANGASINQNAQAISAVQGDLASLSNTVSTQGASISQNAQAITTANQNIASLTTRVGTAESSISQNATAISGVSGRTATLESTVSAHGTSINQNAQAISTTQGNLATLSSTVTAQGSSITALQTASSTQAGQIANLTTRVSAGGANLLVNGGFENGLTGMTSTAGWSIYKDAKVGQIAALSTAAATGDTRIGWATVAVGAGIQLTLSGNASYAATGGACFFIMEAYDASGANVGWSTQVNMAPSFDWSVDSSRRAAGAVTYTTPTGTASVRAWFYVRNPGTLSFAGVSAVKLERGPTWSPFTSESSLTQSFTAINTTTTQVASLSTTVSTQGASISANSTAITTLQTQTATLTTQVNAGSANLLVNGGFENGLTGITTTGTWISGFDAKAGQIAALSSNPGSGSASLAWPDITVGAGVQLTASANASFAATGGYCYLVMEALDASGGHVGWSSQANMNAGFDWSVDDTRRGLSAITYTTPTGTAKVRLRFVVQSPGTLTFAGVAAVKVQRGATWSRFSNEASVAQSFSALSTLTTQYASLSTTVSTQGVTVSQNSTAISTLNTNVSSLMGRWGVEIDVNGYVSGVTTNNNGTRADFTIRADKFAIVSPGGGARTEYSNGNWRVYNAAGVLKVQWGVNI